MLKNRLFESTNSNYADAAKELLQSQKNTWEMCSKGYETLNSVEIKRFSFDGFYVDVQFNPGRLTSSSAKVDPESIKERKCFLCMDNLPEDQKGILYRDNYLILCNPFPIFPEHFTIPSIEHRPQQILPSFTDFLHITKDLSERYIVFYNGPKCGASAPDHFHFQAGTKEFLPVISEIVDLKNKFAEEIFSSGSLSIYHIHDGLRKMIFINGSDPEEVERSFRHFYNELEKLSLPDEEPMMNIVSSYKNGKWDIIIVLREKHRPARFFEEGERNILLSPAAVDLGGVCITPLEKDFLRITKDDLTEIFGEVILNEEKFTELVKGLRSRFRFLSSK